MDHKSTSENLQKLRIDLSLGEWHGGKSEWVWAEPRNENHFVVRNIPFFAKGLSFGDEVEAEYEDGVPVARRVTRRSGHSTYRVMALHGRHDERVKALLNRLNQSGCEVEVATDK